MAIIENQTGAPHFWFEQTGPEGQPLDVLLVKATFDFAKGGAPMKFAQEQQPIAFGDTFSGPVESAPMLAVIDGDGDLVPYKPGTDILVTGHAWAPDGRACTDWVASISVGGTSKSLRLYGPRKFLKQRHGWRISPGKPIANLKLDYRLAFGGSIEIPPELMPDRQPEVVKFSGNPAGCGWLPKPADLAYLSGPARRHVSTWVGNQKVLTAPQIEALGEPVLNPHDHRPTQGFGAIARWWKPRQAHQGTYSEEWQKTRYPLLPEEFDSRYFQSAHSDLIVAPHLKGDERVVLEGLLPVSAEMSLPGWRLVAVVRRTSGEATITFPLLDTVRFHLDLNQASLTWRANFEVVDPVVDVSLAFSTIATEKVQLLMEKGSPSGVAP